MVFLDKSTSCQFKVCPYHFGAYKDVALNWKLLLMPSILLKSLPLIKQKKVDLQDLGVPLCCHQSNRNRVYLLTVPGTWRICWNLHAWEPQRSWTPVISNLVHISKGIDFNGCWLFKSCSLNHGYLNSSSLRNKACEFAIDFQVIDWLLHFVDLNALYFFRFDAPYL